MRKFISFLIVYWFVDIKGHSIDETSRGFIIRHKDDDNKTTYINFYSDMPETGYFQEGTAHNYYQKFGYSKFSLVNYTHFPNGDNPKKLKVKRQESQKPKDFPKLRMIKGGKAA
jgi:hypothetical protein